MILDANAAMGQQSKNNDTYFGLSKVYHAMPYMELKGGLVAQDACILRTCRDAIVVTAQAG
jgi:hypothetical protein